MKTIRRGGATTTGTMDENDVGDDVDEEAVEAADEFVNVAEQNRDGEEKKWKR